MRMKFDWHQVSDHVVFQLLLAAYATEPESLERLTDPRQTRAQAHAVYGTPPNRVRLDKTPAAWDVLRRHWLMREATTTQLAEIASVVRRSLSGTHRTVNLRNKSDLRAFFGSRTWTETLRGTLLTGFRRAHRSNQPVHPRSVGMRTGAAASVRLFAGEGLPSRTLLHPHQQTAIAGLDELSRARKAERRRGLVVLPTGAGKTMTAVTWLMGRMAANTRLRVLRLAHQEELLTQAADTFVRVARHEPTSFVRHLRVVSSGHSTVSTLHDDKVAVAMVTWQSLNRTWIRSERLLTRFAKRSTIVVVDEAHHAGAAGYQQILRKLGPSSAGRSTALTSTAVTANHESPAVGRARQSFRSGKPSIDPHRDLMSRRRSPSVRR